MSSVSLPLDVATQIVQDVNIGDRCCEASAVLMGLDADRKDLDRLVARREDPTIYLKQLFDNSEELLELMRMCRTVLSGSRALDYFVPGSCTEDSDWDFFCPGDFLSVSMFTYSLSRLGVEWEGSKYNPADADDEVGTDRANYEGFDLLQGELDKNGRIVKVQVIWTHSQTALDNIMGFHSSAIQCFISGFCAVSMYHEYTSNNESIYWGRNDKQLVRNSTLGLMYRAVPRILDMAWLIYNGDEDNTRAKMVPTVMKKFISRGFKYVSYGLRGSIAHGGGSPSRRSGTRRVVGDSGCYVVKFDKYLETAPWEPSFDDHMEGLAQVLWYDGYLGTRFGGGLQDRNTLLCFRSIESPVAARFVTDICSSETDLDELNYTTYPTFREKLPWMYFLRQRFPNQELRFSFGTVKMCVPC